MSAHGTERIFKVTYAAAESEAAEFGGVASCSCVAIFLGQQQNEGHGQRQMVEAVDVGVVPLLKRGGGGFGLSAVRGTT